MRAKPTAVMHRFAWPIAAVILAAFALVGATVIWAADAANDLALERQREEISISVRDQVEARALQLASLTVTDTILDLAVTHDADKAAQVIGRRASEFFGFDRTFVVSRDMRMLGGYVDGGSAAQTDFAQVKAMAEAVAAPMFDRLQFKGRADERSVPSDGRIMVMDQRAYIVATSAIAPLSNSLFSEWQVAVGFKLLDKAELRRIASDTDGTYLRVVPGGTADPAMSLPILDPAGEVVASFAWTAFRPGNMMLSRLIPVATIVFIGAAVFCSFIFLQVRRVAQEVAQSEQRARILIGHDPLSGLPNRLPFIQRLDQELARMDRMGEGVAIHFLDLDRFKEVNDTHGHAAGDELIRAVAKRLSDLIRGADTLARFGGDEFAIIQTGVKSLRDVEALARRILESLTVPFHIAGTQVGIGVSIGIAVGPENGTEREGLMRLADTALYQAKNEGRNRFSFFERQMDETLKLRQLVEDDLRAAIAQDELELHYQPQLSADGDRIVGVEALIRWPHARHGVISPAQFIPIAEERGLIIPLSEWVLRRACRDGQRWPGLRIAVNVSAIQFRHKDFVANVKRILAETGFDPARLELELTESVVVDDADAAEAALMELKAEGIHLALDDFGTGYSSLIYLRRFAFDKIKIDRSFLESMETTGESAILVHSIVHLGRALGLTVTAEGVENAEQHRFLQTVGCHELQGFLFSRPVQAQEIDALLQLAEMPTPQIAAA